MVSKTVNISIAEERGMCSIPVQFDPKAVFGSVRAPVKVTINGYTFRSTIGRMGGKTFIPLRKSNREAAAAKGGDKVKVKIELDTDPRTVEVPEDLRKALMANESLWQKWQELSFTHRRECAESVEAAKKRETRERRIAKVVDFVAARPARARPKRP